MQNYNANQDDSDLAQQAYWGMIDRQQLDAADAAEVKTVLGNTLALTQAHRQKTAVIRGDGDLSEGGKRSRLVALITKSDTDLATATTPLIDKLQAKIRTAERSIENAVTAAPTVEQTLRMIEIRGLLYGDDALLTESALIQFAGNGRDDLSVQAILTASEMKPLVSPAAAARARQIMAVRLLPDASGELVDSRETLSIVRSAIQNARDSFSTVIERNTLGIPDDVSIAALGLGGRMDAPASNAPGA